jgi:hypothetical protein
LEGREEEGEEGREVRYVENEHKNIVQNQFAFHPLKTSSKNIDTNVYNHQINPFWIHMYF